MSNIERISVFFGSSTGNTKDAARRIAARLRARTTAQVDVFNVGDIKTQALLCYDKLILGISTWNIGELQSDWYDRERELRVLDFTGKTIALFGLGDQQGYPDTFQDAMGILAWTLRDRGATLIGAWPTEGYDFTRSLAVEDGQFVGLALDYDCQWTQTNDRISAWVTQLIASFGLQQRMVQECS